MANQARKYRRIDDDFVTLGPSDDDSKPSVMEIEGTLLSRDTVTFPAKGNNPPTTVGRYLLERENGRKVRVLGSVGLDGKMDEVPDGAFVHLAYLGKIRTSGGNMMKDFDVLVADANGDVTVGEDDKIPATAAK